VGLEFFSPYKNAIDLKNKKVVIIIVRLAVRHRNSTVLIAINASLTTTNIGIILLD